VALAVGDRVDRYVIEGLLGSGGMGEVYRARDVRLQRSVALKIVKSEPDAGSDATLDSAAVARVLREARAGAALRHTNVVAVFDAGAIEEPESLRGTTFLAMELIAGTPLRRHIGDASVPMAQRLRWLEGIAEALSAAHDAGLIHRDVKPENVMIDEGGTAKVLDFGVAKRARAAIDPSATTESLGPTSIPTSSSAVGTPAYMSPEQLRNEPVDGRADQFAWGVTAYELLCGERPWTTKGNVLELVSKLLSTPPVPLSERCREVPASVAAVVERALSRARDDRFATMAELLVALRPPTGSGGRAAPDRRKRAWTIAGLLVALGVATPIALAGLRMGPFGGTTQTAPGPAAAAPSAAAATAATGTTGTIPPAATALAGTAEGATGAPSSPVSPPVPPSPAVARAVATGAPTGRPLPAAGSAAASTVPTSPPPSAAPSAPPADPYDRRR
jgi:serine/threonine-protein kinase